MRKQSIDKRIHKLFELYILLLDTHEHNKQLSNTEEKTFEKLWSTIVEDLMWEPGKLIYLEEVSKKHLYETMIDIIWETHNSEEILEELLNGEMSGLLVSLAGDYIDRAKFIKPIFVSVDPSNTDFYLYFSESMKCYFNGLNNASIILSYSIFEKILKLKLSEIDESLVYKLKKNKSEEHYVWEYPIGKLIESASKKGLFNFEERQIADKIKDIRDSIVHKLARVTSEQTYQQLINTKDLIENLLDTNSYKK